MEWGDTERTLEEDVDKRSDLRLALAARDAFQGARFDASDAYDYTVRMHTVRMTLNVDEELLAEVMAAHPGVTKTELVKRGLQALLIRQAEERLASAGGTARRARRPKRSAWTKK